MSHEEIWDDSALVESWNDALEEYKKYHSIQVRGEDLEEILEKAESGNTAVDDEMNYNEAQGRDPAPDSRAKEALFKETIHRDKDSQENVAEAQSMATVSGIAQDPERTQPALPQHLIGQVHDEGLKNLLMSWYYAGYYTGLYEGQQKQQGAAFSTDNHGS